MEKNIRLRVTLPGEYAWLENLSGRARSRLFSRLLQEKTREQLFALAMQTKVSQIEEEEEIEEIEEEIEGEIEENRVEPSLLSRIQI